VRVTSQSLTPELLASILARVGIRTDPRRLCTAAARAPEVLRWAGERAARRQLPAGVLDAWGLGG